MRRAALCLVLLVAGCGQLPAVHTSPVGGNQLEHCKWVQRAVENGSMPVEIAEDHYSYCGPFDRWLESAEFAKRWNQ